MIEVTKRKSIRKMKNWVHDKFEKEPRYDGCSKDEFNYKWLNHKLFPKISVGGKGDLRSNYTWGVMQGTHLAKVLGYDRISVIEFGVAGGKGLSSLEKASQLFEDIYNINIDVYGFDSGAGLPPPKDYRDLPNIYSQGRFSMDVIKLNKHLKKAKLILGLIEDTIDEFIRSSPAVIAFIAIDLDYYSSTVEALRCLKSEEKMLLPRIYCYFDDIFGRSCCEYNGERLAIAEFNESDEMRKIAPIYGLKYYLPEPYRNQMWVDKFFMAHIFDHRLYGQPDKLGKNRSLDIH
jgi:hypothetical protein